MLAAFNIVYSHDAQVSVSHLFARSFIHLQTREAIKTIEKKNVKSQQFRDSTRNNITYILLICSISKCAI